MLLSDKQTCEQGLGLLCCLICHFVCIAFAARVGLYKLLEVSVELRLLRCRGAAEDTVLMFDESLAPLVAQLAPRLRSVRAYVVLTDRGHMPRMPHVRAAQSVHSHGAWSLRCKDMPCMSALMLAGRQHQLMNLATALLKSHGFAALKT